jgi:hypothetical protein
MTQQEHPEIHDTLAALAGSDTQREAARHVQDAFTRLFRLSVEGDATALQQGITRIEAILQNWVDGDDGEDARSLRLALLLAGLDQWGLAWSRAFGLTAIPALTDLLGRLRNDLDVAREARCQARFAAIEAAETNAIDFKIELRRGIHLALWHAMIASEERDQAFRLVRELGSAMLALEQAMPQFGWRLLADALAHMQIRCVSEDVARLPQAAEMTQALLEALSRELPGARMREIETLAAQAVAGWRQARRAAH